MQKYKKIVAGLAVGLMAVFASMPSMAHWEYGWHHYHHHHYDRGGDLAAGLVVGGLVGVMAGSAMANSQPRYVEAPPPQTCYQTKHAVWRHHYCDDDGCYVRTKWAWDTECH